MMSKGFRDAEVAQMLVERGGIKAGSVPRYLARVRQMWREEHLYASETVVEQRLARWRLLARKLEAKQAWHPLVQAERVIDELVGVKARAATLVIMPGGGGASVAFDPTALTDEELDQLDGIAVKLIGHRDTKPENIVGDTTLVPTTPKP